jgi:hypothetical protein
MGLLSREEEGRGGEEGDLQRRRRLERSVGLGSKLIFFTRVLYPSVGQINTGKCRKLKEDAGLFQKVTHARGLSGRRFLINSM